MLKGAGALKILKHFLLAPLQFWVAQLRCWVRMPSSEQIYSEWKRQPPQYWIAGKAPEGGAKESVEINRRFICRSLYLLGSWRHSRNFRCSQRGLASTILVGKNEWLAFNSVLSNTWLFTLTIYLFNIFGPRQPFLFPVRFDCMLNLLLRFGWQAGTQLVSDWMAG